MSWLGAGIGAGIGFAIGGPIGAGIGMWLGSSISNSARKNITVEKENQTLFFVLLFSMLGKIAKSDGIISSEEINAVTNFMDEMNLDNEDKKAAITIFNNSKNDKYSIYEYADQYKYNADIQAREMIYAMLWKIAYSDGLIHPKEDIILQKIVSHLGLNNDTYDNFKAELLGIDKNINSHYKLLECLSSDTNDKIKQNYKRIIARYHPDKIQSKGLPKEFIIFANEQAKKVNVAYDAIKKSRL